MLTPRRSLDPNLRTHAERLASRDGYFAPESVIRRVGNSPVTPFLGGGAAVLLQVAHPLVAAGVADHSGFDRDLWRRLVRTLRALYLITFGTKAEADQAAATVRTVYTYVRGRTATRLGPFPPGTPYSAEHPDLMLWVHATLVDASLSAFQRFQQRLSADDEERYHGDMAVVARLFGVPDAILPRTLSEFREYFAAQISGSEITVTEPAVAIARVILRAPLPAPMRVLAPAHRLATPALLPPRIRAEYGLRWSPAHQLLLPAAGYTVRCTSWPVMFAAKRVLPTLALSPA
jgi:uncharacterized protein (DUF2236 family)